MTILFKCGDAEYVEIDGSYYEKNYLLQKRHEEAESIISFKQDSDIGMVDDVPLDLYLQCLEHRLATRDLADPMFERTNALECLRKMRGWLADIAKIEQENTELDYVSPSSEQPTDGVLVGSIPKIGWYTGD